MTSTKHPAPGAMNISQDESRTMFSYDPETGFVTRKTKVPKSDIGSILSTINDKGYVTVKIHGKHVLVHRLIWLIVYGTPVPPIVDHENGIRSDNRILNLRAANKIINGQNQKHAQRHNASGLMGATYIKKTGRWIAQIRVNGEKKHLGSFGSGETAHAAYIEAKKKFHAGYVAPETLATAAGER